MRILLIGHNDSELARLRKGLAAHTYAVDLARSPDEGERFATDDAAYDVIIAQADGKAMDAAGLIRRLRKHEVAGPICVLADRSDTDRVVDHLDAGADDVIDEAADFREVLARLRALMRRGRPAENAILRYHDLELDLPRLRVTRAGRRIAIQGKTLALLEFFVRHAERVLSRAEIGQGVWDRRFDPSSNVIDVTVSKLRQKLDKPFETPYVHTVVRSGYLFSQTPPGEDSWG